LSEFNFRPPAWYETLPSTNTWLLEQVKTRPETPHGTVVAARAQTAGRGRQQRSWSTVPGCNLTFSFLWNAPVPPEHLPSMAQAISVGIAHFLHGSGLRPTIKWPNDVLVGGRKIGGILCETAAGAHPAIVAGIGLNVNMSADEAASIDQPATSMAIETGRTLPVDGVLDALLEALAPPLNRWSTGGFAAIQGDYTAFAAPVGSEVTVRDGDRHTSGTLAGFDGRGALCLTLADGTERRFYSGDVVAPQDLE